MRPYGHLTKLVAGGDIAVVHIDAVPRSLSTALEIACAQLADAQVNEPFNRGRCDLDAAAADVVRAAAAAPHGRQGPAIVITKAIASEINPHFTDWLAICASVIFSVRHPLIQMASLLERIGNDAITGRGTSALDFLALEPYAANVDSVASKDDFRRASWRELSLHFAECARQNPTLPTILVDGTVLSRSPEGVLSRIAALLGRPYDQQAVENWTAGARGQFNNPNHFDSDLDHSGISVNAWVRPAHQSTQIEPNPRQGVCLRYWQSHYPLTGRYLAEHAIPIYENLLAHHAESSHWSQSMAIDRPCQLRLPGQECALG